jgi:hypothetical protein
VAGGLRKQGREPSPEQEDHPSERVTSTLFANATEHSSVAEGGRSLQRKLLPTWQGALHIVFLTKP